MTTTTRTTKAVYHCIVGNNYAREHVQIGYTRRVKPETVKRAVAKEHGAKPRDVKILRVEDL